MDKNSFMNNKQSQVYRRGFLVFIKGNSFIKKAGFDFSEMSEVSGTKSRHYRCFTQELYADSKWNSHFDHIFWIEREMDSASH